MKLDTINGTKIKFHGPPQTYSPEVEPRYNNDHDYFQPAIIPPTIFKQEINDDSRIGDFLSQTILQQWRAAITLLQEADVIIIVGYSFPISDFHSKRIFHISNMLRKARNEKIKILDCIGPNDNKGDRKKLLENIFGKDTNVKTVQGFEKLVGSEELKNFLKL